MLTSKNQRRYFRIEKKSVISIRECDIYEELNLLSGKKNKKNETSYAKIKNLSACGVLIESQRPYMAGAIVKLQMVLEGWEEKGKGEALFLSVDRVEIKQIFKTIARVVRVETHGPDEYEIGLEFLGVEKEQQKELVRYIMKNVPVPGKEI